MKTILLKISFIFLVLCMMAIGCVKEKESSKNNCAESYETVETINDAEGRIGFDEINKQYVINVYVEGTIDEIITLYPCGLSDEFKIVNLKVKIDGKLFTNDQLPNPQFGGQKMYYVDITDISKLNN